MGKANYRTESQIIEDNAEYAVLWRLQMLVNEAGGISQTSRILRKCGAKYFGHAAITRCMYGHSVAERIERVFDLLESQLRDENNRTTLEIRDNKLFLA